MLVKSQTSTLVSDTILITRAGSRWFLDWLEPICLVPVSLVSNLFFIPTKCPATSICQSYPPLFIETPTITTIWQFNIDMESNLISNHLYSSIFIYGPCSTCTVCWITSYQRVTHPPGLLTYPRTCAGSQQSCSGSSSPAHRAGRSWTSLKKQWKDPPFSMGKSTISMGQLQ